MSFRGTRSVSWAVLELLKLLLPLTPLVRLAPLVVGTAMASEVEGKNIHCKENNGEAEEEIDGQDTEAKMERNRGKLYNL
jgi:hypothetical protein